MFVRLPLLRKKRHANLSSCQYALVPKEEITLRIIAAHLMGGGQTRLCKNGFWFATMGVSQVASSLPGE